MKKLFSKLFEQSGYTLVEGTIVLSVLVVVISAAYSLLDVTYAMNTMASDGFEAQNQGRQVLSRITKHMRPAQNMNVSGVPLLYAGDTGEFIDVKVDTDRDGLEEIVRIKLDRDAKQILLYSDSPDASGDFNYKTAGKTYFQQYRIPAQAADWDSVEIMASRIVNNPPDSTSTSSQWSAQTSVTDGTKDYRLFTFYGESFSAPLDTVGLGSVWVNYVRGIKVFLWTDVQPMKIPSPFGMYTNVHLRNISGE